MFYNNTATGQYSDGGGLHNRSNSNPILIHCTFQNNTAEDSGGGIFNSQCNPILDGCVFDGCSAYFGGGMSNSLSSPSLSNCIFTSNSAHYDGGGIFNDENSSLHLTASSLKGNSALRGGGIFNDLECVAYLSYTQLCQNTPDQIFGDWADKGGNTLEDRCQKYCLGDLNSDAVVNGEDLGLFLTQWGECRSCTADLNADGQVGGEDLGLFLFAWGECS